jgi:Ca2+-binding EF-hand superfamily protein
MNLKVSSISYNLFFVQSQKNSAGNVMSYSQFKSFCEILKLSSSSKDAMIMSSLRDASTFSIPVYKILTYHILFTKGSKEEKVEQLFSVYDFNSRGRLHEDEVKKMITTIFDIGVEALLKLAAIGAEAIGSDTHSSYYSSLMKVKTTVIFYLFHHFVDGRRHLNHDEFHQIFFTIEMNVLLVPRMLRKFCFRYSLEQKDTGIDDKNRYEIDKTINSEMMSKFKRKLSSI